MSKVREPEAVESSAGTGPEIRRRFFAFFLISGFCSVLYEVIWLRLAMAQFGVTTAMTSIVISVFMAGLGLGSWGVGRLTRRLEAKVRLSRIHAYALVELAIGVGSLVVPYELVAGRKLLEAAGVSSSFGYYVAAGLWLGIALIPWCTAMGATFPVAMWAMRERQNGDRGRSFSYLYVANVLGALGGAILPLLLIEGMGFRGTLRVGGILNLGLAMWAFALGRQVSAVPATSANTSEAAGEVAPREGRRLNFALLFSTGLTSMGMEVVWIRLYTPFLGTMVYSFAAILGIYLVSTFAGSVWYRRQNMQAGDQSVILWAILGMAALVPLAASDPRMAIRFMFGGLVRAAIGIAPFTMLLGFLTPMLVDRVSGGDPDRAGSAYALNVVGCILGPLVAGFLLLPLVGERWSLGILAAVWVAAGGYFAFRPSAELTKKSRGRKLVFAASLMLSAVLLGATHDFASLFQEKVVLRDSTATVIAMTWGSGKQLTNKQLLINGVGITTLTPITKIMAHLPLALLDRPPQRALDICFGMGTTYRSLLSWGVRTDAAELVPSVPKVFSYFHPDAPQWTALPIGRIIVDDGRRHLERTEETYDLITIDPPPPVEAAGSSLLYSKEFYEAAKRKLRPGGIVAQWLPASDTAVQVAVTRAVRESFRYVRVFSSLEGWGLHVLASDSPIPVRSPEELAARLPLQAQKDLVEWGPYPTPEAQFTAVLRNEVRAEDVIRQAPSVPAMTDDRPINEYYLLRRMLR